MLQEKAPDIKLCLSTNGLALPEMVDEICKYNIDHVTITINMVDPEVGAKIYPWIFWQHRRVTGIEAATILHRQQMLGLEMLTARGVLTKINSVLIPGINDEHLIEVNREVKKRGAFLHNIMPLISEAEHGTVFGLTGQRGPSAQELKAVQDACMGGANLMRHCRQCRADAVGLLGEDRSDEFTLDKIEQMEVVYDLDKRRAYQEKVEGRAPGPARRPRLARWPAAAEHRRQDTSRAGGRGHRRARARSTSTSATPPSSRSTRSAGKAHCSSATAAWTCTARAATARTSSCRPSWAPSTTATPCWCPRSAPARATNCGRRHRAGGRLRARVHREGRAGLVCRLPRAAWPRRDRPPGARRCPHPPGRLHRRRLSRLFVPTPTRRPSWP
jgi:hypothetical protein